MRWRTLGYALLLIGAIGSGRLVAQTTSPEIISTLTGNEQFQLWGPCTVSCVTTSNAIKNFFGLVSILTKNVSSYSLNGTEGGAVLYFTVTSTLTVPDDTIVDFPTGSSIIFVQGGIGPVTIVTGSDLTTINSFNGANVTAGQFTSGSLLKTAPETWLMSGTLVQ